MHAWHPLPGSVPPASRLQTFTVCFGIGAVCLRAPNGKEKDTMGGAAGLSGYGRAARSPKTHSCAHETVAMGTIELHANNRHSWMACGALARVSAIL